MRHIWPFGGVAYFPKPAVGEPPILHHVREVEGLRSDGGAGDF